MKTIKFVVFISSMLLAMSINLKDICFSYPDVYASDGGVKKITDIKSVALTVWSCLLEDDLRYPSNTGFPHHIRGIVIFEDKDGKQCAVDYDGIAELSCKFFNKTFRIHPEDFKETTWFDGNQRYGYLIEFKITYEEAPTLFRRPYETVIFKLGNLEATCELSTGGSQGGSSSQSNWKLYKGKE